MRIIKQAHLQQRTIDDAEMEKIVNAFVVSKETYVIENLRKVNVNVARKSTNAGDNIITSSSTPSSSSSSTAVVTNVTASVNNNTSTSTSKAAAVVKASATITAANTNKGSSSNGSDDDDNEQHESSTAVTQVKKAERVDNNTDGSDKEVQYSKAGRPMRR